jgi:hypothetical protein
VETPQEESITNAILKVTREKNKAVYFLEGHNEGNINDSQEGQGICVGQESDREPELRSQGPELGQKPGDSRRTAPCW